MPGEKENSSVSIPRKNKHLQKLSIKSGIMSRLGFTEFGEELVEDAHEISESEAVVGDHALDLMELRQVGGV